MPGFYGIVSKQTNISTKEFKKLKFIPVTRLMQFAKANTRNEFDSKFVVFFFEPNGNKYIKQRVFFEPPHEPAIDISAITPDTSKHKRP